MLGEADRHASSHTSVLVQREIARRKWRLVNGRRLKRATGLKKGNTLGGPRSHSPRGWKNKLARKKNSDCPKVHTPHQASSVWATFPRSRSICPERIRSTPRRRPST